LIKEEDIIKNWKTTSCKVSVCCLSFNHEAYIEECLNSILIQNTDFPFEILIHDDASSDRSQEIISSYQKSYPSIIKPILQTENQRTRIGSGMNPTFNFPRAIGEYIAFCECDDYWTDKNKLSKQITFLEENKGYGGVVTDYSKLTEGNELWSYSVLKTNFNLNQSHAIPVKNIFKEQLKKTRTATAAIRKSVIDDFSNSPFIQGAPGDTQLFTYLMCESKLYLMLEPTSVYRIRKESVSHTASFEKKQSFYKSYIDFMEFAVVRYEMSDGDTTYLKKSKNLYIIRQYAHERRKTATLFQGIKMIFQGQVSRIIFQQLKWSFRKK
jgi:glycosyltransferase involved in cell wall biosynthesis